MSRSSRAGRDLVGNAVAQPHGRRAVAKGVLEGVGVIEIGFADERQRFLELRFGFAGKADDEVGRERDAWYCPAKLGHHLEISLPRVPPKHPTEDSVRTALRRQMDMLTDGRRVGHCLDDTGRELGGIRAGEAHPPDPIHAAHGAKQIGEIVPAVMVAVDRLTEQRDFGCALPRERFGLDDDVLETPTPLGPPRVRDDAEGAAVIAASLYRDERGRPRFAHGRHVFVVLPGPELRVLTPAGPGSRALRISGRFRYASGPTTKSTRGTRSSSAGPSRWAMHPTTPSTSPARLCLCSSPIRPITRCSALSRTAQVFTSITSASAGSSARTYPSRPSSPKSSSESATFIWQP